MTDIIMAHHGTIDEFIGDAILAVFGAPQHRDDDADRAVVSDDPLLGERSLGDPLDDALLDDPTDPFEDALLGEGSL